MSTENFGIVVEIAPNVASGQAKVDAALDGMETHAKKTGDAIEKALGGSAIEGAKKAAQAGDEASRAFAKATQEAHRAALEEKEWGEAINKAKLNLLDMGMAAEKANSQVDKMNAGITAYDKAIAASATTTSKAASTTDDLTKGWKGITRTLNDVGGAIGAVSRGIDLVTTAFNTSKAAAAEAIKLWNASGNSGPSAYVGADFARDRRLAAVNDVLAKLGENYADVDSLPKEIAAALKDASKDDQDVIALAKARVKKHFDAAKALDDANAAYYAAEFSRHQEVLRKFQEEHPKEYAAEQRAIAASERARIAAQKRAEAIADGRGGGGSARGSSVSILDAPSGWDEFARDIATASDNLQTLLDLYAQLDREQEAEKQRHQDNADYFAGLASALDEIEIARNKAAFTNKGGNAIGSDFKPPPIGEWEQFADTLKGPLSNALTGVIDQIATMTFDLGSMFRNLAEEIARAIIQMLILQGIKAAFGAGGLGGGVGGFLWDIAGGKRDSNGNAQRMAPGDPFGGGASSAGGAVFREAVPNRSGGGSSERQAPGSHTTKVIVVADIAAATLEALKSKSGESAVIAHVANNRGKLGR